MFQVGQKEKHCIDSSFALVLWRLNSQIEEIVNLRCGRYPNPELPPPNFSRRRIVYSDFVTSSNI